MDYPNWFVVVMGVGIVFFGLIILIVAVTIMGKILGKKSDANALTQTSASAGTVPVSGANAGARGSSGSAAERPDSATVAAISAAIAEDMGTDISAIRITSIRKVG